MIQILIQNTWVKLEKPELREFMNFNPQPVVGLREGTWIKVNGDDMILCGDLTARVFVNH